LGRATGGFGIKVLTPTADEIARV